MNIYIGIFVLVSLFAAFDCSKTTQTQAFLSLLAMGDSGMSKGSDYGYSKNTFYSSLLALPIEAARKAIEERDHGDAFECPYVNIDCDWNTPWRTFDGTCNNRKFPWWGAAQTPYKRILPAKYEANGRPRSRARDGSMLENPRTIALQVHFPKDIFIEISNMLPLFSQFVYHDLSHFAETKGPDGHVLKCKCSHNAPEDCINIPIPESDYWNKDKKCLVQVRDRPSYPEFNCYTKNREHLNEFSSYLDLSQIYGADKKKADQLRAFQYGKLKVSSFEGLEGDFLPTGCPKFTLTKGVCFNSGDSRVNQYPLLTAMHVIWVREHNRVAEALWQMNPYWDDELTFQVARSIVIAEYQHIIYSKHMEVVIGKQLMEVFDLFPLGLGQYFMEYDEEMFPNVANEFSAAASRYGHALTIPWWSQVDENDYMVKNNSLWSVMWNPRLLLFPDSLDSFIRGSIYDRANWFSPHITDYLSNDLKHDLGPHNPKTGHSLPAFNINRGRDHGLRSYNDYRPLAGLKKAKSWDELTYIPKKAIERLRKVYRSVDDIELFAGAMSEYPLPDAVVGPTFGYIIGRGFRDWKYGDRWYYENGNTGDFVFAMNQLDELKKSTLARIICDNTNIKSIVMEPLLIESKQNPKVDCDSLPTIDLSLWKDWGSSKGGYSEMRKQ